MKIGSFLICRAAAELHENCDEKLPFMFTNLAISELKHQIQEKFLNLDSNAGDII